MIIISLNVIVCTAALGMADGMINFSRCKDSDFSGSRKESLIVCSDNDYKFRFLYAHRFLLSQKIIAEICPFGELFIYLSRIIVPKRV